MTVSALDVASHLKHFAGLYKYGNSDKPLLGIQEGEVNEGSGAGYRGWRFMNNLVFAVMLKEYANSSDLSADALIQDSKQSLIDYLQVNTAGHRHPHRGFTEAMATDAVNDLTKKLQEELGKIKSGALKPESLRPVGYYNRPVPMLSAGAAHDGKGVAHRLAGEALQL